MTGAMAMTVRPTAHRCRTARPAGWCTAPWRAQMPAPPRVPPAPHCIDYVVSDISPKARACHLQNAKPGCRLAQRPRATLHMQAWAMQSMHAWAQCAMQASKKLPYVPSIRLGAPCVYYSLAMLPNSGTRQGQVDERLQSLCCPSKEPPEVRGRAAPGLRLAVADALARRRFRQVEQDHVVVIAARVTRHLCKQKNTAQDGWTCESAMRLKV